MVPFVDFHSYFDIAKRHLLVVEQMTEAMKVAWVAPVLGKVNAAKAVWIALVEFVGHAELDDLL